MTGSGPPLILLSGFDTLEAGFYCQLSEGLMTRLDETLEAASKHAPRDKVMVNVGGIVHEASRLGGVAGWQFALVAPDWAVKLSERRRAGDAAPDVAITWRSAFLWERGPQEAVEAALDTLWPDLGTAPERSIVSRADLCCDWTGWNLIPDDAERTVRRVRYFVARWEPLRSALEELEEQVAAAVRTLIDASWGRDNLPELVATAALRAMTARPRAELLATCLERDLERTGAAYRDGTVFTGFSWGKGAVGGRLYRKDVEIRKASGKRWFYDIWTDAAPMGERSSFLASLHGPDDAPTPIWRLEFQLRRAALREYGIDDLEQLWRKAGGLWKDLTLEWLTIRAPRTPAERARLKRAPLDPSWRALAEHRFRYGQHPVVRERVRELDRWRARGMAVNAVARVVATHPQATVIERLRLRAALKWFETEGMAFLEERERSWPDVVQGVAERITPPREVAAAFPGLLPGA